MDIFPMAHRLNLYSELSQLSIFVWFVFLSFSFPLCSFFPFSGCRASDVDWAWLILLYSGMAN